jgi:hypothetical protein
MNSRNVLRLSAAICLLVLVNGAGCSRPAVPTGNLNLSASVMFRCIWWSSTQMDGLNPNDPPPKNTEVTLQKWEYSDPIGVPHPDIVDAVVEVKNESNAAPTDIIGEVTARWRTGPLSDEKDASWGDIVVLQTTAPFSLSAHDVRTIRVPVNVAQEMAELQKTKWWPYTLRVQVTIKKSDSNTALSTVGADLPIVRGD